MTKAPSTSKSPVEVIERLPDALDKSSVALVSDWNAIGEAQHVAQFYETDDFLLDSLSQFVSSGLTAGEACIIVATHEHRQRLEQLLLASGLDLATASAKGQYIALDAADTLAKFTIDGQIAPDRFAEILGQIITRAAAGQRRVRIFGEMVMLLWMAGKTAEALWLEELWNKLQTAYSFLLFCGYPIHSPGEAAPGEDFNAVCEKHSHIIPAESYAQMTNHDDRLRAIVQLQQKASALEAEIIRRKQAEESTRLLLAREQEARLRAEEASRLKDEFLATVSHELRTPLTVIMAWAQRLRRGKHDQASVSRGLEIIERNAAAQSQLVEDILDVSRIITGKLGLSIAPVDLIAVINAAIDSVQLAAEAKGVQLAVILDPSVRHILGDAGRLQQVIWNLLSNAIKFTPAGGRVEVRLERCGSSAQISVRDTGEGISAKFLPFVFDRFRQADGTSTRKHGGLGLGLSIVRHLVELHGGTVQGDSPGEGCGAVFTIRLPLAATEHETPSNQ